MDALLQYSQLRHYFLRREALDFGVDDRSLHAGVRSGAWVRIRQGAYCHASVWRSLSDAARHLARAWASYDLTVGSVCLSHVSALAAYGCPLWRVDLDGVHLTRRDDSGSRVEAGVTHHNGSGLADGDLTTLDGRGITTPARSTIDAMTVMPLESAVVAGDWMLHQGLATHDGLWRVKQRLNQNPRTRRLETAVPFLDPASESPGESRCRYLFWWMHLPCPKLQWPITDSRGNVIAVVDFAWPAYDVYGEFDGKIKFGRLLRPGQSAGDAVFEEKRREDAIRRHTGGTMVRWTWSEIHARSEPSLQLASLLRAAA